MTAAREPYHQGSFELIYQQWGAFIVLVGMGVFMARVHLKEVILKALGKCNIDDSMEMTRYRTAVIGFLLCAAYLFAMLMLSGLSAGVAGLFLLGVLIIFFGITRIVIECGIVNLRTPIIPQTFLIHALGTTRIGLPGLIALATNYTWFCDIKAVFMPAAAHADKMRKEVGVKSRHMGLYIFLSVIIATVVSTWFIISKGYQSGAYNWNMHVFSGGGYGPYTVMIRKFRDQSYADSNVGLMLWMVFGGVLYGVINMLRFRFVWWPLHPVGMTINTTLGIMQTGFSVFIGWACKALILKIGGAQLYHKFRYFFIGLILGHFAGASISFILDVLYFGVGKGHLLHGW